MSGAQASLFVLKGTQLQAYDMNTIPSDDSHDHIDKERIVTITYEHSKHGTVQRRILPIRTFFGTDKYHPEPQYLLTAWDLDKLEERTFALMNITGWNRDAHESGWRQPSGNPPKFID